MLDLKKCYFRSAEEQLLKLRKYEYQMFLDNKLPPPFSSARAQAARFSAENFKQLMGVRNRLGIGLSYRTARLHSLAELVHLNRFLVSLKVLKCDHLQFTFIDCY